jgi:hypothetical protein
MRCRELENAKTRPARRQNTVHFFFFELFTDFGGLFTVADILFTGNSPASSLQNERRLGKRPVVSVLPAKLFGDPQRLERAGLDFEKFRRREELLLRDCPFLAPAGRARWIGICSSEHLPLFPPNDNSDFLSIFPSPLLPHASRKARFPKASAGKIPHRITVGDGLFFFESCDRGQLAVIGVNSSL